MDKILKPYTGETLTERKKIGDTFIDAYLPSDDLIDAVNLAMQLSRPLLIMGEPGCGKTRLAEAVAYELHGDKMNHHYFRWDIKSTTKAKDGIYQYDALGRLYDVNAKDAKAKEIEKYIEYGALAKAFKEDQNGDIPNVLLIDEIDKADIDFPNDLLLELENKEYIVKELNDKKVSAKSEALIFVTSNQEKELPPAFLRRCLYHFIEFPDKEKLKSIVSTYIKNMDGKDVQAALETFEEIRSDLGETDKKPSTSELIDWFKMLDFYTEKKKNADKLTDTEKRLIAQLDSINDPKNPPFPQILFKTLSAKRKNE